MGWTLHVDRGGTFTDVVGLDPAGRLVVAKHLSQSPDYADPIVHAVAGRELDELRIGTTVATNALLERKGARVLLLTTRGFGDLLEIGTQERPDLFALRIEKRPLLHAAVAEIDERVRSDGTVEHAPDPRQIAMAVRGWDHVAVCFLNAWAHPGHELLAGDVARAAGVTHVTLSHQAAPMVGAVARGETTVADAYLTPGLAASVQAAATHARRSLCMQSSGGLVPAAVFRGKDAVLSGPAGGVVAALHAGRLAGERRVIGFDMGGTSTDVCRCDDGLATRHETLVEGFRIAAPAVELVTVASGGGSILERVDGRFVVGPQSAGADPGPACYGRGGPATLTDANLVLGRLRPEHFPHLALDAGAAQRALSAFGDPWDAALGFLTVAIDDMGSAIRRLSVARGYDAREHALVAFGGAGGGHACALARSLGMRRVIVHPLSGVLSAWGLSLAQVRRHAARPVVPGEQPAFPVDEACAELLAAGWHDLTVLRSVDVRCTGQDATLTVPWTETWAREFHALHRRAYGFAREDSPLQIVTARVEAVSGGAREQPAALEEHPHAAEALVHGDGPALFARDDLAPGARLTGPALVLEANATTVVEHGWALRVDGHRQLLLEDLDPRGGDPLPRWPRRPERRAAGGPSRVPGAGNAPDGTDATGVAPRTAASCATHADAAGADADAPDPVTLQVMSNRFMTIAELMGEHLQRTAHSTNIKERRDFSCAVFDAAGQLVANAPHIPVHLGAIGETVRHMLEHCALRDGDAWLSNDPYHGGSHLPDITVVTPVFRAGRLAFLVANRGHHADVGGKIPGSMPPRSTSIHEEGALLCDVLLVRDGRLREGEISLQLAAAGARDLPERLADLQAQAAACAHGARLLHALCDERGDAFVTRWMGHVLDNGEAVMADVLAGLRGGSFRDGLDDGSIVAVNITVADGRARIDFTGTSPQQPGNRNAPRAVARAAVLYVFRTLAARPIPLNDGCARVLDIVIPEGSLLDPRPPAAVVGGNVETSQRVVDVLYGALDVLAASQGTMNNLTFGDARFGYYETICGGAGAGYGFDGAHAVHTHMTNTRITDPEVLEQRCPVVVRRFALRRGSGGAGVWRGGDGVVREIQFLRPLAVNLLAERRASVPFGLRAAPGAPGQDELGPGGVVVNTPGGGGYSPSDAQWAAMSPAFARRLFREGRWPGTTDGIAVGFEQLNLLVLEAEHVEALLAGLPSGVELVHRGAPGEIGLAAPWGPADLSTDLPRYVRRVGGMVLAEADAIAVSPRQVVLLLRGGPAPIPAVPHRAGAPGRLFVSSRPAH